MYPRLNTNQFIRTQGFRPNQSPVGRLCLDVARLLSGPLETSSEERVTIIARARARVRVVPQVGGFEQDAEAFLLDQQNLLEDRQRVDLGRDET